MDKRLDKFESKLDSIDSHVHKLSISTAENTASLKEHMSRSDKLETQTTMLARALKDMVEHFESRIIVHDKFKDKIITIFNTFCYLGVIILGVEKLGLLKFLHL